MKLAGNGWRLEKLAPVGFPERASARPRRIEHIRTQARACAELGSPLYADLMQRAADDVVAGGVTADVLAGHEKDPGPSALALRLFGAVHRIVLEGRAPTLERYYPSVGGTPEPGGAWQAFTGLLHTHREEVRERLRQVPQTNEVGRSAALLGGLLQIAAWTSYPIRLHEIGTSGGLNLRADCFRYEYNGGGWGPQGSSVLLDDAWRGVLPPVTAPPRIVERRGADLAPADPATADGRLRLMSYVWADQTTRMQRLRGAFQVAQRVPVELVTAGAHEFVAALDVQFGRCTVLWHSVTWQYLGVTEQAAVASEIDRIAASARLDAPFAVVSLEPQRRPDRPGYPFTVTLRRWPGGQQRMLGEAAPHGLPVTWWSGDSNRTPSNRTSTLPC